MYLDVRKVQNVGATAGGYLRIGVVPGGSFEGERLSGEVLVRPVCPASRPKG